MNGWKAVEEVLRPLPGLTFEDWQKEDESPHSRRESRLCLPLSLELIADLFSHFSCVLLSSTSSSPGPDHHRLLSRRSHLCRDCRLEVFEQANAG